MESTPPRGAMEASTTTLRGAMEASSPTQQPRGAIAYLAQGVRHSTYGRDSLALLRRSLSLLYENYAAADAADTILFHRDDSDFPPAARDSVLAAHPRRRLRFERIPEADWSLPPALLHTNRSSWYGWPKFALGYRFMCRWWTVGIWPWLAAHGYTHLFRLDEDSFLLSPLRGDVFRAAAAAEGGFDLGYRMLSFESGVLDDDGDAFHAFVRTFIDRDRVKPAWLLQSCVGAVFSPHECGELAGVYTNFMVSSVAFWRTAKVRRFLQFVDDSNFIFTRRYGDLPLLSVAIQLFMPVARVKLLDSFTYEHATREQLRPSSRDAAPCIVFGGIAAGTDDALGRTRVLRRLRDFCDPPCIRSYRANGSLVVAATAGVVFVEQPACDREPPPFWCAGFVRSAKAEHEKAARRAHRGARERASPLETPWHAAATARFAATCALPSLGVNTTCNATVAFIESHANRQNAAAGCRFDCPQSVMRFLATCRPETGCVPPPSYRFAEEIDCSQRAMRDADEAMDRPDAASCRPTAAADGRCGRAMRAVTARADRHNPRAGIDFACAASLQRYLWACRPETRCAEVPLVAATAAEPNCSERALVGADEAAGGGPHAFRSQRLRQLLGPRSRDLKGDRERRLMGPQGRKHVYRMHHCEPLSAVL